MGQNGGARPGAGRKPKADELKLVESLSAYDEIAQMAIKRGVMAGDYNFVKLFCEYRYGKPRQQVDVTTNGQSMNQMYIVPQQIGVNILNDIPEAKLIDDDTETKLL